MPSRFAQLPPDVCAILMVFVDEASFANLLLTADSVVFGRTLLAIYMRTHNGIFPFPVHEEEWSANTRVGRDLPLMYPRLVDWIEADMCRWAKQPEFRRPLTVPRLKVLCDAMATNRRLKRIRFREFTKLAKEHVEYLATRLDEFTDVFSLYIDNATAKNLGELLKSRIKKLSFTRCHVDTDTADGIADTLRTNTTLAFLDIVEDNYLEIYGLMAILEALLHENRTLIHLRVDNHGKRLPDDVVHQVRGFMRAREVRLGLR